MGFEFRQFELKWGLDVGVRIPAGKLSDRLRGPPSFLFNGYRFHGDTTIAA